MIDIEPISLGIALVLSAAFVFPIFNHSRKIKLAQQKKLNTLLEMGIKEGYIWNTMDFWRNEYLIAVDKQKKVMAYYQSTSKEPILVDLNKYKMISIVEVETPKEKGASRIHELHLKFQSNDPLCKAILLEFYNAEKFSDLNGEFPLVKKWEAICKETAKLNHDIQI
jgi:hypothetical protein